MNINLYEIRVDDNIIDNNTLLDAFLLDCQCALFLVDITNTNSIKLITKLLEKFTELDYPHLKKIIVKNKSDIIMKNENKALNNFNNFFSYLDEITISSKAGDNFDILSEEIYNSISPENNIFPINQVTKSNLKNCPKTDLMGSISIILVGDTTVGKTSFMLRYDENKFFINQLPTAGFTREKKIIKINGKECYDLNLLDTSGQERFRSLPKSYYKNVDGVLLLFDINDKDSFKHVSNWMKDIKEYSVRKKAKEENQGKENKEKKESDDVVVYLIGNKIDKIKNDNERKISKEEGKKSAENLGIKYYEISCLWNLNIEEVMDRIIIDCYNGSRHKDEEFKLKNINDTKSSCC